jgi:hypothetical protein
VAQPDNGESGPSLEDVSLVSFSADPTDLNPFESSLIRWHVTAPAGVTIELSGAPVAKVGNELVEPASTTTYSLVAKIPGSPVHGGGASKVLGHVVVNVHLSQCRIARLSFLDAIIRAGILSKKEMLPSGAYFREEPRVTVTPGQIQIHLSLGKDISWIRDPDIDIDMSFGLTLAVDTRGRLGLGVSTIIPRIETRLASLNESHTASVTEPWYVYLQPLISFPLALALAMAEDGVRAKVPGIIQTVVDGLDARFHPVGFEGLHKHTVMIGVDEKNIPFVEASWCPPPPSSELVVKPIP